jgi:hypothetical protein
MDQSNKALLKELDPEIRKVRLLFLITFYTCSLRLQLEIPFCSRRLVMPEAKNLKRKAAKARPYSITTSAATIMNVCHLCHFKFPMHIPLVSNESFEAGETLTII